MLQQENTSQLFILEEVARLAMLERDLKPDFSEAVQNELAEIRSPASQTISKPIRDLRHFLWFSIDNDDSKDLDQLTFVLPTSDHNVKVYVAIADVEVLVKKDSAINEHAEYNTTSVYTSAKVFPMLPEKLSTDFTSLNQNENRCSIVVEMSIDAHGAIKGYDVYPAYVRSYAKLAYNSITAWLEGKDIHPEQLTKTPQLEQQLWLHDSIAKIIKSYRVNQGEISLETVEFQPIIVNGMVVGLQEAKKNRARLLIETLMIAANTAATHFLLKKGFPVPKRIVQTPKRWDRIVALARSFGDILPDQPNAKALERFLLKRKHADPIHFSELSLTIIKSLGKGEVILTIPGQKEMPGHFDLALQDYSHVTAPNRRYLDLVIQRMLKAAIEGKPCPYSLEELDYFTKHCTTKEADAEKVERRVRKSAAAMVLESKIGSSFKGMITGASSKGTWVRIFDPPVEGKLVEGFEGLDIGNIVNVKLLQVDIRNGFIDFCKI